MAGLFMNPEAAVSHFHIREGDVVGDFGAGPGHFIPALARAVGTSGRVYACEIQKGLVDKIGDLVHQKRLRNVHPLWTDLEVPGGTKLAEASLDIGILVNTLFQLEHRETACKEIARVIRKGGRLFVIDWVDSFGGIGPHPSQVMREDDVKVCAEQAGFTFERSFSALDHHYGLAFRRR